MGSFMKRIFLLLLIISLGSCAILKGPIDINLSPMAVEEFLSKPFNNSEDIQGFNKSLPEGTRVRKLIKRSPRQHHKPDTIYNFLYKKSKISVYKTRFNQEFLLGGNVLNPNIELANGIQVGMTREEFFNSFTNLQPTTNDTIVLKEDKIERTFNFYFGKRDLLDRFSFTGKQE